MITIKEVIDKSAAFLESKGISNSKRQAEELISFCLSKPRIDLYMEFDKPLAEAELTRIRTFLKRRALHEPIQQIEGSVEFLGCSIALNRDVLIPRQETELLVEKIVGHIKGSQHEGKVLFDIGTGSGVIAIALKKKFPSLIVYASDLSLKALEVAQANAKQNNVEIHFLEGNLLEPFKGLKADFVVSNPPYIPQKEYLQLEPEVKEFEPKTSLVSGESGLECYQAIAYHLKDYLNPGARAWFEIGYNQGDAVKTIFESQGFDKAYFETDLSGQDRFFFLELE